MGDDGLMNTYNGVSDEQKMNEQLRISLRGKSRHVDSWSLALVFPQDDKMADVGTKA